MLLGMDVYHDPKKRNRSVCALVASLNPTHTKYYSRVMFQQAHQESVDSLKPIFIEALQSFLQVS